MPQDERATFRSRGFTLIELLVVMTIVGVLAVAGVYMTRDNKGPAVQGVLYEFAGFLANARNTARGTGTQIILTPAGSAKTFTMTYSVANGPTDTYNQATQISANNYCQLVTDITDTSTPAPAAITSLQSALSSRQLDSVNLFTTAMWTNNLCSTGVTFNTNGTPVSPGIAVVAATNAGTSAPVGIILVTSSGNVLRYYRSGSTASWVRK